MRLFEVFRDIHAEERPTNPVEHTAWMYQNGVYSENDPQGGPYTRWNWSETNEYPVNKLVHLVGSLNDWKRWYKSEIKMFQSDGMDGHARDLAAMVNETIHTPVVVVEVGGRSYLWDGYHRTAASVISGKTTIPAIVGTLKTSG